MICLFLVVTPVLDCLEYQSLRQTLSVLPSHPARQQRNDKATNIRTQFGD